jgi:hypothetical protein
MKIYLVLQSSESCSTRTCEWLLSEYMSLSQSWLISSSCICWLLCWKGTNDVYYDTLVNINDIFSGNCILSCSMIMVRLYWLIMSVWSITDHLHYLQIAADTESIKKICADKAPSNLLIFNTLSCWIFPLISQVWWMRSLSLDTKRC